MIAVSVFTGATDSFVAVRGRSPDKCSPLYKSILLYKFAECFLTGAYPQWPGGIALCTCNGFHHFHLIPGTDPADMQYAVPVRKFLYSPATVIPRPVQEILLLICF